MLRLTDENLSLSNGDWVTLQSLTNETFTFGLAHSQTNSTIRWTDALKTNPFWSSASKSGDEFSIKIEEPVNLIHIESTNVNGDIHIVRMELTGRKKKSYKPTISDPQLVDDKAASSEDSVSLPLLLIVGVIAAYILIIVSMKGTKRMSSQQKKNKSFLFVLEWPICHK